MWEEGDFLSGREYQMIYELNEALGHPIARCPIWEAVEEDIRPGVLVETTKPYRMTDRAIPDHYIVADYIEDDLWT